MVSIFQQLDSQVDQLFGDWSIYSTLLAIALTLYLIYPLISHVEPEIHPFLLERQAAGTRVRQPGFSAIYRALETPHGYPLKSGLGIRDPGQPKWTAGRDGDLRDVWKRACLGKPTANDDTPNEQVGLLKTISGNEEVLESTFEQLSKELNAIGKYLNNHECKRVAIYLSNSTELLVSLMAGSFYDFTPILIPPGLPFDSLAKILNDAKPDAFIVGAGSVPLNNLFTLYRDLKHVIWVVPRSSRHVDWNEVPEGEGGTAEIATWHDIVDEEGSFAPSELPSTEAGSAIPNVILVSANEPSAHKLLDFTQKNLVSAISAQLTALPQAQRFSPSDTLLPLASLTSSYPLILTLTALYSNATIALTSVTGPTAALPSSLTISPTTILVEPDALYTHESRLRTRHEGFFASQLHSRRLASLAKGIMPLAPPESSIRLIYTWNASKPLILANLRAYTGARVINALTHDQVAGAVSQTNPLDYRQLAHFGPPLSCVEIWLEEVEGKDIGGEEPIGELIVKGPAVSASTQKATAAAQVVARGGKGKLAMKITGGGTLARGVDDDDNSDGTNITEGVKDALSSPVAG